jgi:hypothetical protein
MQGNNPRSLAEQGGHDSTNTITNTGINSDPHEFADLAARIRAEHEAFQASARTTLDHACRCGDLLIEAKRQVGEHGRWGDWLREYCHLSNRRAQAYMRLARNQEAIAANASATAHLTIEAALQSLAKPKHEAKAHDVIDPASGNEIERLNIPLEESQAEKHRVELANRALRCELEQLPPKTEIDPTVQKPAQATVAVPGVAAHLHIERAHDLYETPACAVRALLTVESLHGLIYEPTAGRGAIARVLRDAGHEVIAHDLIAYEGADGVIGGVDFFEQQSAPEGVEFILTNPPFRHINKFLPHALKLVTRVILLLPQRFAASERRRDILTNHLARVYFFTQRLPMMHRYGWQGPKADSWFDYGWWVFDRNHHGPPAELHLLSWRSTAPTTSTAMTASTEMEATDKGKSDTAPPTATALTTITPTTTTAPPEGASRDDLDDIPEFLCRTKTGAAS